MLVFAIKGRKIGACKGLNKGFPPRAKQLPGAGIFLSELIECGDVSDQGKTSEGGSFEIEDLEIFENVAYIMAFHADHSISSREMTTPLFLLRCTEIGISIRDLDLLTIGLVMDMWTEKGNDSAKYSTTITAGQEEFDRF